MPEKKSKQMLCRATPSEKQAIEEKASEHGFSSRSRYMVKTAAEGGVLPPPETVEVETTGAGLEAVAEEVREGLRLLAKAGQNLNQVVRKIHSLETAEIIPVQELRYAADQIAEGKEEATETLADLGRRIDQARRRRSQQVGEEERQ